MDHLKAHFGQAPGARQIQKSMITLPTKQALNELQDTMNASNFKSSCHLRQNSENP